MRILLLLLIAIMAHLAPAKAADDDWTKIAAAAKKEGKLVIYGANAPAFRGAADGFEKKYGIKLEMIELPDDQLSGRIRSEQGAGHFLADIEQSSSVALERQMQSGASLVQAHGTIPNLKNLREPFVAGEFAVPVWAQAYGFLINTDAVSEQQMPRAWQDLFDPKWEGRIVAADPRLPGAGSTMFAVTALKYGDDFPKKMAKQKFVLGQDPRSDIGRVLRGENPVYFPLMYAMAADMKDLPIQIVLPSDGSPYQLIEDAVIKNAPHPNAARLFINHVLERDSQIALANGWMQPVVKGAAEGAGAAARPYAAAKLMAAEPADKADAMEKLAKEIYQ
jgi:ABC-type Fe3+ transport system substrate-binding protein